MSANTVVIRLGEFVDLHSATIDNALANQARRMTEAADLASGQGEIGYAKVFREEATNTDRVLAGLRDLLEELAEQRQEDHADQG